MAIKLVIDSSTDISDNQAKDMGVILIPMIITIDGEDYLDGSTLSSHDFYKKLATSKSIPKTSQITAYRYEEVLDKLTESGDEVIVMTISSKLSNTYNNAFSIAKKYNGKVSVIDSLNATAGGKILVEYALNLINQGLSRKEIVEIIEREKKRVKVFALIDTLEFLKKGGRISTAASIVGGILSIKPIIAVIDGEVKLIGKSIGLKKGNVQLCKLVNEFGIDFNMPYSTIYSGLDTERLDAFILNSKNAWQNNEKIVPKTCLGATIGTHIGPGAIGVAFFAKNN